MSQRRSLVDGLSDTPEVKELEKDFVFGDNTNVPTSAPSQATATDQQIMPQYRGRVPMTTRCRPELASAIKRVSLERQLNGMENSSIQDIIEQALTVAGAFKIGSTCQRDLAS